VLVVGYLAVDALRFMRGLRESETRDAVCFLQEDLQRKLAEGHRLTDAEIVETAQRLKNASVYKIDLNAKGMPVDSWSVPLRVNRASGQMASAGPDHQWDTSDDIGCK
jgi:hypothetical protein